MTEKSGTGGEAVKCVDIHQMHIAPHPAEVWLLGQSPEGGAEGVSGQQAPHTLDDSCQDQGDTCCP